MALSNWDTLAIGPDGKSSAGEFTFHDTTVEIYKNWLCIHNPKMYVEGSGYASPVIASINSGDLNIGGVTIYAKRGKQSGIYFVAFAPKNKAEGDYTHIHFGGIGCSGYKSFIKEWLEQHEGLENVNENEWWDYFTGSKKWSGHVIYKKEGEFGRAKDENGKDIEYRITDPNFELTRWVGVEQDTLIDYKNWLHELLEDDLCSQDDKIWVESIQWDVLARYNQGDAYFAAAINQSIPATIVGEQEQPILMNLIKDMK